MLTQKLALSYGSRIFLQFIQIAVTVVVARVAGPSVLGTIAFGMAFVNMFAFITDLGIPTAYIKSINDGDNEAEANGTFFRIQLLLILLFVFVVISWLIIQKYGFHYKFESETHEYVIFVFLMVIAIQRLFQGIKTLFIAKTQQAKQDIPDLIYSLIYQGLRLVVVLLGYKALAIAFSNLVATIIIFPFYLYLLKPYPIGKYSKILAKKYFSISIPLILIIIVQTVLAQSDKVMLQYFTDSKTLGFYTAGFKIGGFVQMIASVIGLLFFPLFTKAIAENDIQSINLKINKFERFMFSFVFPATAFAAIFSDVIVKFILGNTYLPTVPILSVITISMFFLTLFQPYANTILAKGKFYQGAYIYLSQLVIFLLLAFVVLSHRLLNMGGIGLAWVVLISNLFLGILFVFFSKKNIKEINIFSTYKLFIYAIIFFGFSFVFYVHLMQGFRFKIIFAISFFILYWFIGNLLGLIKRSEWEMLYNVINVTKMKKYIAGELKNKKD